MFNRVLLTLSLIFMGAGCAFGITNGVPVPNTVVDSHGGQHFTGLIARKVPLVGAKYFTPGKDLVDALPDKYDSRTENFVAPIKDQGQCGSCWDFSMTKSLESARLANANSYLDLAEQDGLVNAGMEGCNGGWMDATYWVQHGLTTEGSCPYKADDGVKCKVLPVDHGLAWGFVGAEGRAPTEDELKAAIYKYKVISITVAAGGRDWEGGNSGHMTACNNRGTNHMVNLVGYDCTTPKSGIVFEQAPRNNMFGGWWPWPRPRPRPPQPKPAKCSFIGANSWGTDWGDHGFFYAAQGCNEMASDSDSALWISYQP